ncbi:DUF4352 domain-containing protein [Streptomyces sp. NBC_00250]|uniref:DUF4352 domain-containing protein n=1 Tax=Streptomyces sp. NBC_00250 TaxID=2903641 RepID=UPI002E2883E8|nr:DUF4352 domain-containing protein [Streptomyces sp. NBC_00250]
MGGLVLVVGLVGVLIGAGAFGGGRGEGTAGDSTPPPPVSTSPEARATSVPPSSETPTPRSSSGEGEGEGDGDVRAFGRTQGYEDGVEVTVSAPVAFTPSTGAAGHTAGNATVAVDVTVRNGGDVRLELATVQVQVRDSAGRAAGRVFDAEPHLGAGLSGTLLPDRKALAAYNFDVPPTKGSVLDVEVKVGERPSLFWSGEVG